MLEVLGDMSSSELGPQEAWARLRSVGASGQVRPDRLARAAKTEPPRTRARLAALLADSGHAELAAKVPAVAQRSKHRALAGVR